MQHGKIAGVVVLLQRSEVLVPGILVKDRLRPFRLVVFKHLLNDRVGQNALRTEFLVHGAKLCAEGVPEIVPEDGLLAIEHIRSAGQVVSILQIVGKRQGTFVVTNSVAFMTDISLWKKKMSAGTVLL